MHLIEQLTRLHAQRHGELLHHGNGWVPGPALDVANVSAVDLRVECERFLRQFLLDPKATQVLAEACANIHPRQVTPM